MSIVHTKPTWDQMLKLPLRRVCDLATDGLEGCREAAARAAFWDAFDHWYPFIVAVLSLVAFGLMVRRIRGPLARLMARPKFAWRNSLNHLTDRRADHGTLGL
jgi:hypothetical protein